MYRDSAGNTLANVSDVQCCLQYCDQKANFATLGYLCIGAKVPGIMQTTKLSYLEKYVPESMY